MMSGYQSDEERQILNQIMDAKHVKMETLTRTVEKMDTKMAIFEIDNAQKITVNEFQNLLKWNLEFKWGDTHTDTHTHTHHIIQHTRKTDQIG